jgi:hypothetical protein
VTPPSADELKGIIEVLSQENVRLRAVVAALPKCLGTWVSGEGMEAEFAHDCPRPATWNDERDDLAYPWRFCDRHKPEHWPAIIEEYPYAEAVRALEANHGG